MFGFYFAGNPFAGFINFGKLILLTDSGSGSDGVLIFTQIPITESGSGSETLNILASVPISDSGSGVDAVLSTNNVAITDSGVGTETLFTTIRVALSDSGLGVETIAIIAQKVYNFIIKFNNEARYADIGQPEMPQIKRIIK
jgi:hypothetical protein